MAIAPSNTAGHHALLLINPHTSFYFRSELQMVSDEGLDAYGAVTWGQFFIYQGFNDRAGWMHTSSGVNAVSQYLETVVKKGDRFYYKYGNEERPLVIAQEITVPYKTGDGMAEKKFTVYRTHHGPIIGEANGKWVSIRLMQEPVKALTQSYTRTKAKDYKSFRQTHGAPGQFVEQHDLRGCRRRHRLLPRQFHSRRDTQLRLDQAGGRQQSRRRSGKACFRWTRRRTC